MRSSLALLFLCLAPAQASALERSCLASAGPARSAQLVRQCRSISEATHPPCNAANPCALMIDEIASWCEINRKSRLNLRPFCRHYPARAGTGG